MCGTAPSSTVPAQRFQPLQRLFREQNAFDRSSGQVAPLTGTGAAKRQMPMFFLNMHHH